MSSTMGNSRNWMNRYLKTSYLFGIFGGIFCVSAFVIMYFMEKDPISFTEVFGYVIIPVFVFLGIKNFKDSMNKGELAFGQGMTIGFFIYSILALISSMGIFIFLHLDPVIFDEFKISNLVLLKEKKEVLIEQLDEAAYFETFSNISNMTIFDVAINDFLRKVFPGLFFTIIISIILKRSKN